MYFGPLTHYFVKHVCKSFFHAAYNSWRHWALPSFQIHQLIHPSIHTSIHTYINVARNWSLCFNSRRSIGPKLENWLLLFLCRFYITDERCCSEVVYVVKRVLLLFVWFSGKVVLFHVGHPSMMPKGMYVYGFDFSICCVLAWLVLESNIINFTMSYHTINTQGYLFVGAIVYLTGKISLEYSMNEIFCFLFKIWGIKA